MEKQEFGLIKLEVMMDNAEPWNEVTTIPTSSADGVLTISHYDEVINHLSSMLETAKAYEFTGSDRERINNNRVLAALRKGRNAFIRRAKDNKNVYISALLERYTDQVTNIDRLLDEIETTLVDNKAKADADYESARRELLNDYLTAPLKVQFPAIAKFELDTFTDKSLFLRGTSDAEALRILSERVMLLDSVIRRNLATEWSDDVIAKNLARSHWDTLQMFEHYESYLFKLDLEKAKSEKPQEETSLQRTTITISVGESAKQTFQEFVKNNDVEIISM